VLVQGFNVVLNGCEISFAAKIGSGFKMQHTVGIVIGHEVIAGSNLNIYQNVTIGKRKGHYLNGREYPIIGNNVTLYPGSVIIGPITIGDNVVIGANAVVINNVISNSIAIGIPAKVISSAVRNKCLDL